MIFDHSQQNLNAWKTQMHMYQKGKRTKKPFGKTISIVQHVTHQHVKERQSLFNPVLQKYSKQSDERKNHQITEEKRAKSLMNHLKQTIKYQKNFDIVNLNSNQPYTQKKPMKLLGPIRNNYNVINNQKMPDFHFENRQMRLPVQREKKLLAPNKNQYDILSNVYLQNHEQRIKEEIDKQAKQLNDKYRKTHGFDPVYGTFYDPKQEEEYQRQRASLQQIHGKDVDKKLPPSYVYRESYIQDYSKPLPQSLKILDERNAHLKKRYQTKYVVLDEYQKRNLQDEEKQQHLVKNHVHFGRILDQKAKEFNIVTNNPYKQTRAQELFGKKLEVPSWDVLIKQAAKSSTSKSAIKSGGFV